MEKVTESTISGQFRGWKGRGAYKLKNGEIWKQVQYKHKYIYDIVSNPKAIICVMAPGFILKLKEWMIKLR